MAILNKNTSMGKTRATMQNDTQASAIEDQIDPSAVTNEIASVEDQDLTEEPGED
jgi:chitodextrinase